MHDAKRGSPTSFFIINNNEEDWKVVNYLQQWTDVARAFDAASDYFENGGLHPLEDDYPAASWTRSGGDSPLQHPITTFVERGTGAQMGKFSKSICYQDGRVYFDTSDRTHSSYFDRIPQDVWEFHVGGYQVLYKWLYDRRATEKKAGRVLTEEDIAHYQRVVVALKETIRLMGEIDAVIEDHGGWPIR